jgi:CRP-like cAMP-binding protein
MTELWNLHKLNLFSDLQPKTMEQVLRIVTVKHFHRGEFVFRPGDACDRLYLLQHGRIKAYVLSEQGQEKIMHVFYPGDAFGGLLFGMTHGELPWAEALEDVIVVYMDEAAFKRFMQAFPDLCMNLFRYMADHHADDMRRLESFIHTDASQRLLLTLLNLGDRLGYSEADSFQLDPGFTHEELANMVGVARTTVSELISQLRRSGVLGGRGRCLIVNRQSAEQLLLENQT